MGTSEEALDQDGRQILRRQLDNDNYNEEEVVEEDEKEEGDDDDTDDEQ